MIKNTYSFGLGASIVDPFSEQKLMKVDIATMERSAELSNGINSTRQNIEDSVTSINKALAVGAMRLT